MIEWANQSDLDAIVELAATTGLVEGEDTKWFQTELSAHLSSRDPAESQVLVDREGPRIHGAVFFRPKASLDRVWDLTMIAVHPSKQGVGIGTALMSAAENRATKAGGRLLLVETSGTTTFRATRSFYRNRGYTKEARIRDYWSDGDDLVVFSKRLIITPH